MSQSTEKSDKQEVWLQRLLLKELFDATHISMMASLMTAFVVILTFWDSIRGDAVFASVVFFALTSVRRFWLSKRLDEAEDDAALENLVKRVEINALTVGGWWGCGICYIMMISTPEELVMSAILGAGMTTSGALTYRSMRVAARKFVGACGLGCGLGLLAIGSFAAQAALVLLITYVLFLFGNIDKTSKNICNRHRRERELEESAETINMLLTDFTEQGSDWLVELDQDGKIISPSIRFAEVIGMPVEVLDGISLMELLQDGEEKDGLADHLENRRAFRNHSVMVNKGKEALCWLISARPLDNERVAYRGVITDITAQRQAEKRVTYMAHFDALTDLPNRFQFQRRLVDALQSDDPQLGLMFVDLDEFKAVNDTLGHAAGDIMLKRVADRLRGCVTGQDVVARLGGDEFAILLPHADKERIDASCKQIIAEFAEPFALDGQEAVVGVSIGVVLAPEFGTDSESLLTKADLALYEAKAAGRNRHTYFRNGMDVAAQNRRELEQDLRKALARDELCLHYQSLVNIETGKTNGYEALIRWEHPQRGVVMPDDFISIAEESGLIVPIGEWVIRKALDDMESWPDDVSISINLSPVQMRSASLISTIVNALAKTQVDPGRLCLEITESVLMHDSDANIRTLHKLHELGLQIALDDFGTGYSSLNYLRSFPFDKIKIDRCFISEIESREDCQAIVRSVVNLAGSLGMTTTAEGVESDEQLELLRKEGCREAQGYLYSKAMPQEHLTDLRTPVRSHARKLADLAHESDKRKKQGSAQKRKAKTANKKNVA